ncbi:MAG: hypothetical protein INR69_03700 [Mucilaginibacter polytrichastri]|nr:hypothetical protein [Mucilaginibacter polytrichastri]
MKSYHFALGAVFTTLFSCSQNAQQESTGTTDTGSMAASTETAAPAERLKITDEQLTARFGYEKDAADTSKTEITLKLSGTDSLHVPIGSFPGKGITLKELDSNDMPKGSFIGSQVMDLDKGNGEEFVVNRCNDTTVQISKRHIENNVPTEKFKPVNEIIVAPKTKIKADIGYKAY